MEEVDNIIIDSLKNLNCDIDENVESIKDFNSDMVVDAVVSCLEAITPGIQMPHKLPPSMSLRLKLASTLAERIKDLGFRGDMGYQTILYCNEVEVRRMLMFLIERIPRESGEIIPSQEIGYVPKIVKQIEEKIKTALEKPWVPAGFFKDGTRDCGFTHLKQSYQHTYPLYTEAIQVPKTQAEHSEEMKQYWIHHLPDVTKQCHSQYLIPSLLFKDCEFAANINISEISDDSNVEGSIIQFPEELKTQKLEDVCKTEDNIEGRISAESCREDKIQILLNNLKEKEQYVANLQGEITEYEDQLHKLIEVKKHEEEVLKDVIAKLKIKNKLLTVLSKEENLGKLKNMIQNGNERLAELAKQWKDVQEPLLQQYDSLKHELAAQEQKLQVEQDKIKKIREKNHQLTAELKDKEKLEQQLKQESARFSKNTNRSAYTRRILEIIGNIKKQNEEIQKVLKDTKEIQKDINNLNGQLDRSFTLSDELIFRNAKQDEMSRKAYKLLVSLHNECGFIIQAVTEIGQVERESRNLQDQIDAEIDKDIEKKLKRVTQDLQEVKKESVLLLKQLQV